MLAEARVSTTLPMPGLEPDNLLAFLALLGLLRALEASRPDWQPCALWKGPPWIAHLGLSASADQQRVAHEANQGLSKVAARFDVDGRKRVDFTRHEYRRYAARMRCDAVQASLASALCAETSTNEEGVSPSPLVMMVGQGHQFFLERLMAKATGAHVPDDKIVAALFEPWRRDDDVEGFSWDPEDDQRYAVRYGNPSKAGAALTVAGANRLATIGFLSFVAVPRERRTRSVGAIYNDAGWYLVWPIWTVPMPLAYIEALLAHPDLQSGNLQRLRPLGVIEILRARGVSNGRYMNVARARPFSA